jgi:hypothetical protein
MYVLASQVPAIPPDPDTFLAVRILEVFVTVFLSMEMGLELSATLLSEDKVAAIKHYLTDPWVVIDIINLVAYWWYIISPNKITAIGRVLRVIRPLRSLRLLPSVLDIITSIVNQATLFVDISLF